MTDKYKIRLCCSNRMSKQKPYWNDSRRRIGGGQNSKASPAWFRMSSFWLTCSLCRKRRTAQQLKISSRSTTNFSNNGQSSAYRINVSKKMQKFTHLIWYVKKTGKFTHIRKVVLKKRDFFNTCGLQNENELMFCIKNVNLKLTFLLWKINIQVKFVAK